MKRSALIALALALVTLSLPAVATVPDGISQALAHEFVPAPTTHIQLAQAAFIPIAVTSNGKTTFPVSIRVQSADCIPVPNGIDCTVTEEWVEVPTTIFHNIATAESWRPLVAAYFPANQVDTAIRVMACESNGLPYAQNTKSTAGGLFQFLNGTWYSTGFGNYDKYDPEANIAAAASWLALEGYATWWWASQWECY